MVPLDDHQRVEIGHALVRLAGLGDGPGQAVGPHLLVPLLADPERRCAVRELLAVVGTGEPTAIDGWLRRWSGPWPRAGAEEATVEVFGDTLAEMPSCPEQPQVPALADGGSFGEEDTARLQLLPEVATVSLGALLRALADERTLPTLPPLAPTPTGELPVLEAPSAEAEADGASRSMVGHFGGKPER